MQLLFLGVLPCSELITVLQSKVDAALQELFAKHLGVQSGPIQPTSQDVFYLWLYAALFEEMEGRRASSLDALATALNTDYAGDDYMLAVANVHWQRKALARGVSHSEASDASMPAT